MKPEKVELILARATEVFLEQGFDETSIAEVARRAGVGKGTIYLMSQSKADLFYQCVHRDLQLWSAQVARCVDPRKAPDKILREMAHLGARFLQAHPLVIGLFSAVHAGELPDWAQRFEELRTLGRATLTEVLKLGIQKGQFRSDLDLEETSALLQDITQMGYVLYGAQWAQTPKAARRRIDTQVEVILKGLLLR